MTQFIGRTKICYGPRAISSIEKLVADHAFIVTDTLMEKFGFVERVESALERAGVTSQVFNAVEPDPSLETVRKGTLQLLEAGANLIIAVGGGSVIDAAKAMKYFVLKTHPDRKKPQLVVIPTTSGTGSEVTAFSVITDTERHLKIPLTDDLLIPDMAVLDARFTRTVPPSITAATGMDVLTHALEAYVSTGANAFTDIHAVHATTYTFRYLLRAFRNGDDMEAREKMLLASCMAGMAFNNGGLGLAHGIAHGLGGMFHIPHGKANAVVLPDVIRFNQFDAGERYRDMAVELGLPAGTVEEGVDSLIEGVRWMNSQMGIPMKIRDLGIPERDFRDGLDALVDHAIEDTCTKTNPRRPSHGDLSRLLERAW